jgi:DNA primase
VVLAPLDSWVGPARSYAASRGITAAQVERWGLGYAVEGPLAARIVLPVRDGGGRVVSYSARTFARAPKRYLSAKREEGPDPSAVFGEHLWPPIGRRGRLLVSEGSINALALERAALPGDAVGALEGSDVHLGQLLKVSTFRRVLVVTDPDPAGDAAAGRLEFALSRHVDEVARLRLPPKNDPATVPTEELRQWIGE